MDFVVHCSEWTSEVNAKNEHVSFLSGEWNQDIKVELTQLYLLTAKKTLYKSFSDAFLLISFSNDYSLWMNHVPTAYSATNHFQHQFQTFWILLINIDSNTNILFYLIHLVA